MSSLPSTTITRKSFRRGMMHGFNDENAPPDAAVLIDNMLPALRDGVETRNGRQRRNDTIISTLVYGVFRWLGDDESYRDVIAYKSGSDLIYGVMDGTGAPGNTTTITGGDGEAIVGAQVRKRLFLAHGKQLGTPLLPKLYVFDSTVQVRAIGPLPSPTIGTSVLDATAGNLTGSYTYKVTALYDDDGESNPSSASNAISTSSQQIDVNWSAPTALAGMTLIGYRIYRRLAASGVWRFVDEVALVTTYQDNKTDAFVDAQAPVQMNHNAPPKDVQGFARWDYENKMVCWGKNADVGGTKYPNRLFISMFANPEVYRTAPDLFSEDPDGLNLGDFIDVPAFDQSNEIITVRVVDSWVYVFNLKGVRVIIPTGNALIPYRVETVAGSEDHGILGANAVTVTDVGELYYASTDGLRIIRGRIDVAATPSGQNAGSEVRVSRGSDHIDNSCNCIIQAVPESLRRYVAVHEFRDRVHIALATDEINGVTPTVNNDVLIYDTIQKGFFYSSDRRLYGFMTVNDSGNPYRLVGAGYDLSPADGATMRGMVWNEYVAGVVVDEDADGTNIDINWEVRDFARPVANLNVGSLMDFVLDAGSLGGVITVEAQLDGGRLSASKQFTFLAAGVRAWVGHSYWQADSANDTESESSRDTRLALFTAPITDGSFKINVDTVTKTFTGIDFTGDTTWDDVVATIQAVITAAAEPITIQYIQTPGNWRITHDTKGSTHAVDTMAAGGAGTDLATTALLGTGAGDTEIVTTDPPSSSEDMVWGTDLSTATENQWSNPTSGRVIPRHGLFDGERCYLCAESLMGTAHATIYGWRQRFDVLQPSAYGVT